MALAQEYKEPEKSDSRGGCRGSMVHTGGGFHRSMSRFSSHQSVWHEKLFLSFVCFVAFPVLHCLAVNHVRHSSQLDRANGRHNTVVQGKYIENNEVRTK